MNLFLFILLPIVFFISGIGCLAFSNRKPNRFIGYRTKLSLSNEEIWKFANYKFGILAIRTSVIMFIGNMMFYAIGTNNGYLRELFFFIIFVDLSMFLSPIFVVEEEIKNKFKDIEVKDYSKSYKLLFLFSLIIFFIFLFIGKNIVNYNEHILSIDALLYADLELKLEDIKEIKLSDDFDYGNKIAGVNNLSFNQGIFRNKEIDKFDLYVYVDNKTSILLYLNDGSLVVFNKESKEETNEIYEILIKDFESIQK